MKKIFILICTLFTLASAHAQCPQYVAFDTSVCHSSVSRVIDVRGLTSRLCGDTVVVTFNDSLTSLSGSRQVYFHAGPEFRPFTGFQGAYTADSAMRKIGPHLWTIRFNPRNFFHYSADSCLNAIACGFRDSAFVHYVKDGSNDIFILTYTGAATTAYPYVTCSYIHNTTASYLWNDGRTDSVRLFNAPGFYTVTATGVGGCTASGYVHIKIGNANVSLGNDTVYCNSGYVLVPTPGFSSYRWGNGTTSNTYIGFNPGRVWVRAIDSVGCYSYDTVTVHYSQTWGLKLGDTLNSCPGTPVYADASVNINRAGDSLVIIYDATQGVTQLANDTNVYFHSGPEFRPFTGWQGAYTVGSFNNNDGVGRMTSIGNHKWRIAIDPQAYYGYLPDSNLNGIFMVFRNYNGTKTGKDASGNNIFVYTNGVFPFHNLNVQPTCSFAGVTPSLTARQPLSYTWSNGAHTAADTFTTSGIYKVTVTDGVCSRTDSVFVNFSNTLNLGAHVNICAGDTATLNAGVGFTHYVWSTGDTTQTTRVTATNTYTVTATNASGCTTTGQISVNVNHPSASLGPDVIKCNNTPATLTAPAGFASYQWIGRAATSSNTFSATKTGTYWVMATDSFGCKAYDTISVRYSEVLQLSLQDTFSSCPGNLVNLDAGSNIQVYGDSIVIFYDATQGQSGLAGASKVYMHSGPEFHPFQGWVGQYTVGHFGQDDGVGRMDSLGNNKWRITIFPQSYYGYSPDTPLNGIWMVFRNANGTQTGKDNTGNNIFLNLSTITPTCSFAGVTAIHKYAGTMTYSWSNSTSVPAIAVGTTGHYSVTVSDGTCSNSDTTFVNLTGNLRVNIGNDTAICQSGSARFNAGAGFAHYHWSTGDTTQSITVSAAGSYSVTVSSISGCSASDTAVVRINGTKVNAGADITRCNTLPVTLSASNGYLSYKWFGLGASSQTHSAVNDGCYWLLATDSAGCTSYDTVCVSTSGVAGLHSRDTLNSCAAGSSTFDASVNVNAKGDSLVITFDATQNTNSAPLLGASKIYMHSAPQFYPFAPWGNNPYTVGNWGLDDGVGKMDSVGPNKWSITIFPSCYYHFNPDTPLNAIWMVFRNANGTVQNAGGNINLLVAGVATPTCPYAGVSGAHKSTNNITYSWSSGQTTAAATFNTAGTYYVTATDGSCSKTDTLTVIQNQSPAVNLGNDTCVTTGHTVTLNAGTGFSSYLWSTGASTQTITANLPGTYWVRVSNGNCTGSDTIRISTGASVNLGRDTCINSGGSYLLTAGNGTGSYLWNTGATTDTLRVTTAGTYSVLVSQGGCTASDTVVIGSCNHTIPGCKPVAYFRVLNVSIANTVTFKDSSLRGKYFTWTFGDGTSTIDTGTGSTVHTYGAPGIYTVKLVVCDSCGCDSMTKQVNVNYTGISEITGLSQVNLYPNPTSNICNINVSAEENLDVTIELSNMLGAVVKTAKWQITSGENKMAIDLSDISSGMYTVTIRSALGILTRKLDIIK